MVGDRTNPLRRPALAGALALIVAAFTTALVLQWEGRREIPRNDGVSYVVAGVNMVAHGEFTNSFGQPELWFPPLFPLAIGAASLGGTLDPYVTGRVLAALAGIVGLVLVFIAAGRWPGARGWVAALAAALLAADPVHQTLANSVLSQTLATAWMLAGFILWMKLGPNASLAHYGALGVTVSLSYLARPEALLLLPAWAIFDIVRTRSPHVLRGYVVCALASVLVVGPYIGFLYSHTGKITLSNKGEVNLAAGRASHYGQPREFIDPDTLEMGYFDYAVTPAGETKRYLGNWATIAADYTRIYPVPLGSAVLLAAALGAMALWRDGHRRVLFGLVSQFGYLALMAAFDARLGYLHATLPALTLLAAYGSARALAWGGSREAPVGRRAALSALALGLAVATAEGAVRAPLESMSERDRPRTLLIDVGRTLASMGLPEGVMYEYNCVVTYYAGQLRRRLTPNDLATVRGHVAAHEAPGVPVYLTVTTLLTNFYHPSVKELVDTDAPPFPLVHESADERGTVRVFRMR